MITMTEPQVDERAEQPYMGIRTQVPMSEFPTVIPQSLGQIFGWLEQNGIAPSGAPFMRLNVIDMAGLMDISLGVPVQQAATGDGKVTADTLPPGRYASLIYTGRDNGIPANAALLKWGGEQGLKWDKHNTPGGDAFGARYESFLTDPDDDPDPERWQTEVAIRLADE